MNDLVLVGSGGLAREILQIALDLKDDGEAWNLVGFLDDNPDAAGTSIHDLPVLGGTDWLASHPTTHVTIAIGAPMTKRKVASRIREAGANPFATLIHPQAWVGRRVEIGLGSIICPGTMITTDIKIGDLVTLNLDCTVGHDAAIGNYATVAPSVNISGNVEIGEGCDLGTGSTIIQGKKVGHWTILGAGAVVVRDLPANVTAVGAPAKPIKERPEGWHLETDA